jgi:hypothetical protein
MNGELYALLARFDTPQTLVDALRRAREAGYERVEAYSPYPIDELEEVLPRERIQIPYLMFAGGLLGAVGGWALQYYCMVIGYPMNIGGRPLNSWPLFVPIIFEMTVLTAATVGVVAMIAMNGLPRPYQPVFHVPEFAAASRDKFFLAIEAADPRFDRQATAEFLTQLAPECVLEVPP